MAKETCQNCEREIGKLEQAYVYKGHIVCLQCNKTLTNQNTAPPAKFTSSIFFKVIALIIIAVVIFYFTMSYADVIFMFGYIETAILALSLALFIIALVFRPTRKAMGVVLCVLGTLECLSGFLIIIGLPTIFIGALLLFI